MVHSQGAALTESLLELGSSKAHYLQGLVAAVVAGYNMNVLGGCLQGLTEKFNERFIGCALDRAGLQTHYHPAISYAGEFIARCSWYHSYSQLHTTPVISAHGLPVSPL